MTLQSTVASIQNIRKQRQLELELVEIDRQWHLELKALARERLTLIKDLCKIRQDQRGVDHLPQAMRCPDLTHFANTAHARLQRIKEVKEVHKFDFQPDPVDKIPLQFPLIPTLGEVVEVRTSKELYNRRVQVQKTTFEQCMADRRSRRRPFWDKAVLGKKKKRQAYGGLGTFPPPFRGVLAPLPPPEPLPLPAEELQGSELQGSELQGSEEPEEVRGREGLSKSPSLPALNTLRRFDSLKPRTIHPSLSKRHSASLDYLPVIKTTRRHHHGLMTSQKGSSVSSVTTLPTIDET